jgi:putative transposase
MVNKAFKIKLYPNKSQQTLIDKTVGCSRFLFNQMLNEKIEVYKKLKDDKDALYTYKYKTEKQYKEEFEFLKEVSSRALQQSRIDLETAYKNFYRRIKKGQKAGFPKFKAKHKVKLSYREPQVGKIIEIKDNKIKLLKLGWIKFKGLSKDFSGKIKSVTVTQLRSGKYIASVLVETEIIKRKRKSNNIIGADLGLKSFIFCSNGEEIKGIREKITDIEGKIKKQQKHISRKVKGSNRRNKAKIKLNRLYEYKSNFQNHFQWHLANKLCSENQAISLENLNVKGMLKNRKLSHAIHNISWSSFLSKLEQKSKEYDTEIFKVDRFFPSSKMCSKCGKIKEDLKLSDRTYDCSCGNIIDRDLNASINLRNNFILNKMSGEFSDYRRGESVRPVEIIYNFNGQFSMKRLQEAIL